MTISKFKFAPVSVVAPFALLAMAAACGKSSSSSDNPASPVAAQTTVAPQVKNDSLAPNGTTPGTDNSVTVTGNPVLPNGGVLQNPTQQNPGQVGSQPGVQGPVQGGGAGPIVWIDPSVKPGSSVVQGNATYQVVSIRFPKKIVAKPLEFMDLNSAVSEAQPVLTSGITIRGVFVPAGTHLKGTLQTLSGGASTFQVQWLQLDNNTSVALQGGGYIATEDSTLTSANATTIAAGALIGGGIAALVDHFVGSSHISPWIVVGGAAIGAVAGLELFPSSENVVVIQKDELANVGLN